MTFGKVYINTHDLEVVKFSIIQGRSRAPSRITTLDFCSANFVLFRDILVGIPWARVIEGKEAQENW